MGEAGRGVAPVKDIEHLGNHATAKFGVQCGKAVGMDQVAAGVFEESVVKVEFAKRSAARILGTSGSEDAWEGVVAADLVGQERFVAEKDPFDDFGREQAELDLEFGL